MSRVARARCLSTSSIRVHLGNRQLQESFSACRRPVSEDVAGRE
jgi:hypothetical protein